MAASGTDKTGPAVTGAEIVSQAVVPTRRCGSGRLLVTSIGYCVVAVPPMPVACVDLTGGTPRPAGPVVPGRPAPRWRRARDDPEPVAAGICPTLASRPMSVSLRLGAKILTGIDVRTSATWYAPSAAVTCGRPAARRKIGPPFTT